MISRYDKEEISRIWSDENRFKTFLKVELAIMQALEGELIPRGTSKQISQIAQIKPQRIAEIEQQTRHDIIAFCSSITEQVPPEVGRFFHFGVTSSDIIDSALNLQLKESLEIIIPATEKLWSSLKNKAEKFAQTICMGRSHGMFAEPMSFGQKWLSFANEIERRLNDLKNFYQTELTVQFSGAVGNYTVLTPAQEKRAAEILNMKVEPVSTQVIPRDRLAKLVSINALIGSALERIAVEIRHLHRSDVHELHEGFKKGQKGSSTMPHKKNPISSENITGLSRLLRSHVQVALENIVLWHERDISHSSAERLYLPDNLGIAYYAITRLTDTIDNLAINSQAIEQKVKDQFTYLSSYYLHQLLVKTDNSREKLYELIQAAAFESQSAEEFHRKIVEASKFSGELKSPNFEEIKRIYLKGFQEVSKRQQ